ncbi:MAG: hypothetical protein HGA49_09655 [Eubacteriaceae bacterium]|nr:hypothetical protein [Eubacteriaceae bacterium]
MKIKKLIPVLAIAGLLAASGAAMASGSNLTPAEVLANLTGKTTQALYQEREKGETFGQVAAENGQLEEFQKEMLAQKKLLIQEKVENKEMTQEQANAAIKQIEENQANCDGTPDETRDRLNLQLGSGQGGGNGQGQGCRAGQNN